jgi:hypothetical protein
MTSESATTSMSCTIVAQTAVPCSVARCVLTTAVLHVDDVSTLLILLLVGKPLLHWRSCGCAAFKVIVPNAHALGVSHDLVVPQLSTSCSRRVAVYIVLGISPQIFAEDGRQP